MHRRLPVAKQQPETMLNLRCNQRGAAAAMCSGSSRQPFSAAKCSRGARLISRASAAPTVTKQPANAATAVPMQYHQPQFQAITSEAAFMGTLQKLVASGKMPAKLQVGGAGIGPTALC